MRDGSNDVRDRLRLRLYLREYEIFESRGDNFALDKQRNLFSRRIDLLAALFILLRTTICYSVYHDTLVSCRIYQLLPGVKIYRRYAVHSNISNYLTVTSRHLSSSYKVDRKVDCRLTKMFKINAPSESFASDVSAS